MRALPLQDHIGLHTREEESTGLERDQVISAQRWSQTRTSLKATLRIMLAEPYLR